MRKVFTLLCAALMSVGMFATTVTWDSNTLSSIYIYDDESFTQDGVTVTSLNGVIDGDWQGGSSDASFKFSTSLGNFTKIEITGTIYMLGGSGWTLTSPGAVWTGEANETTFGQNFDNVSQIVFTIGEPEPEPAGEVTVVFAANNKTVERTVTLPHTFKCDWNNGMDGPDELDIIIHELYNDYYYCNSNMNASGSDQVEVGTEENPKNDYITIKGVFEGTATVTGDYFDWITGEEGKHNYSITISIKGDEPQSQETVVTITNNDFPGMDVTFTKDGVTVSADWIDNMNSGNLVAPGSFSTTLGNFTKIEVNAGEIGSLGEGWSGDSERQTWTGNASSVSFSGDISGLGHGITIKFTIVEAVPEGIEHIVLTEKAQKVVVDGMIYIVRDGKLFNLTGAQVR